MINTNLESDEAVYHITTSQLQDSHMFFLKKITDTYDILSCQGSNEVRFIYP